MNYADLQESFHLINTRAGIQSILSLYHELICVSIRNQSPSHPTTGELIPCLGSRRPSGPEDPAAVHWVALAAPSRPERPGTQRAPSSPIGPRPPCFHRQDTDFWVPSDWPHATARGSRRPRPPGGSIGLQKQAAAFRWKGGKVENVWHRLN